MKIMKLKFIFLSKIIITKIALIKTYCNSNFHFIEAGFKTRSTEMLKQVRRVYVAVASVAFL